MNKKWMPIAAGILIFISAAFQLAFSITTLLNILLGKYSGIAWAFAGELAMIFAPLALSGTLCVVGGVYALKRNRWPLSLAGSIAALFPCVLWLSVLPFSWFVLGSSIDSLDVSLFIGALFSFFLTLGITAIVLTVLSKKEFK